MDSTFIAQVYGKSMNYTDIPNHLFKEYNVKKGLRNEDGTGVRVGLTRVSDVFGYDFKDGQKVNAPGRLYYRGYSLDDLVAGKGDSHYGFEEVCFLLLFGYLPNKAALANFSYAIKDSYALPEEFLEKNLMRTTSPNLMNTLQTMVLMLYNYDEDPDNTDVYQTVLKGLNILAKLPAITCYAYQNKIHHYERESLFIHYAKKDYSIAENFLHMTRQDSQFTPDEANLLDILLMIHADHGGGNNSTFTNVVVSSTGTDIYSSMSASIGSLKGPRHGGANIRCSQMLKAVIDEIGFNASDKKIREITQKLLAKDFYDHSGLIYGLGHAVYTESDPRANILKNCCESLARKKNRTSEFEFLTRFETIAKETLFERNGRTVSNNVDFYSGFAYDMLQIPKDMFTPMFVCSRTIGWLAHNVENKLYDGKIMRPATKYIGETMEYKKMEDR